VDKRILMEIQNEQTSNKISEQVPTIRFLACRFLMVSPCPHFNKLILIGYSVHRK
jgi:hypothetical protein